MADQGKAREPVWPSAASLELLGPVRLSSSAGDDSTPKARKSRALLAVLALAGAPVPRSRLGDLLWGDRGEEQAKASLRQALYELRSLADSGALCADRQSVSLNRAKLPTDLSELERSISTNDFAGAAAALEHIRWPLLSDLDDLTPELDEWLRDERARIGSAIVRGAAKLAGSALESGQPAMARRIADAVERIDPLDERLARLGASADLALGDRAAAHRRIGRIAVRLKEQLGLDLAPDTHALLADEAAPSGAAQAPRADPPARLLRLRSMLAPALVLLMAIAAAAALYLIRPAAVTATPTIAVLPFEQIGQKQDYFASGVSDEILNLLSHQRQMRVLGRISAAEVGDRSNSMDIARKLGISHLVDGSVRASGDRVLVIVRMTRVADGAQLWSERYERQLGDIFAVQKDIASAVASRLARSIGPNAPQATSPEVYDRYLAARQLLRERRELPLREADRLLREAIRLDPGYAPAHAELSQVIMLRTNHPTSYGSIPFRQARAEAEHLAKRAIALDPNLGDAHAAMGFLCLDHDRRSEPYFRRAVALSPQRPEFHRWHAQTLFEMERYDEAIREYERAVAIDPLWSLNYDHLIGALYLVGREREGQALARRFMALSTDPHAKLQLQRQMAKLDYRIADELRIDRALYRAYPEERQNRFALAAALAKLGERGEARSLMRDDPLADAILGTDWPRMAREARSLGRDYWDFAGGYWNLAVMLVASGHSDVIVELYDQARPLLASGTLEWDRVARPMTILALRKASRGAEADRLLSILTQTAQKLPRRGGLGDERELELMAVSALTGRDEEAIRALDRWSKGRVDWIDHNPAMSLRRHPLFGPLAGHPRFAEIDERLRNSVNASRRQAELSPIGRQAWVSDAKTLLTKN
jgi:TolB-like protein/DNA-binding SARP family transcriptional activator/Tfp pilus assembly protein PilF